MSTGIQNVRDYVIGDLIDTSTYFKHFSKNLCFSVPWLIHVDYLKFVYKIYSIYGARNIM